MKHDKEDIKRRTRREQKEEKDYQYDTTFDVKRAKRNKMLFIEKKREIDESVDDIVVQDLLDKFGIIIR